MARRPRDRPFPVISLAIALFAVHLLASDLAVATDAVVHFPDSPIVQNVLVQERKAPTSDDQPSEHIPAEYASLVEQMQSLKHRNEAATLKLVKLATALRLMIRAIGAAKDGGGGASNRNAAQDGQKKPKPRSFDSKLNIYLGVSAIGAIAIGYVYGLIALFESLGVGKDKQEEQPPKQAEENDRSVHETKVNQIDSTVDNTLNLAKNLVPADRSVSTQITASEKRLNEIYSSIDALLEKVHSVNSRSSEGVNAKEVAAATGDRLSELFAEAEEEMTKMRALCEQSGERCL